MGLQNQLTDISSESFPILMVALIFNCVGFLRSIIGSAFQTLGFPTSDVGDDFDGRGDDDGGLCDALGSGLAGLIMLTEQLNLNRVFSYEFESVSATGPGMECVFCMNRFEDGDRVRKLACGHVFHKQCFDGWLDHLNFSCPLCREKLVEDERVAETRRRVAADMVNWFSQG